MAEVHGGEGNGRPRGSRVRNGLQPPDDQASLARKLKRLGQQYENALSRVEEKNREIKLLKRERLQAVRGFKELQRAVLNIAKSSSVPIKSSKEGIRGIDGEDDGLNASGSDESTALTANQNSDSSDVAERASRASSVSSEESHR